MKKLFFGVASSLILMTNTHAYDAPMSDDNLTRILQRQFPIKTTETGTIHDPVAQLTDDNQIKVCAKWTDSLLNITELPFCGGGSPKWDRTTGTLSLTNYQITQFSNDATLSGIAQNIFNTIVSKQLNDVKLYKCGTACGTMISDVTVRKGYISLKNGFFGQ